MENYKLTIADVVRGALGLYTLEEREQFPMMDVYDAFYKLWVDNKEELSGLYFSIKGGHQYSKQLEEIFFQLGTSGLLEITGLEHDKLRLSGESKKVIYKYLKKNLSCPEFKKVSRLSEILKKYL